MPSSASRRDGLMSFKAPIRKVRACVDKHFSQIPTEKGANDF
jgi:hypothetical protein